MQYPIVYALAVNCSVSPLNVRKHSDADADSELAANLGETGVLLQNLIGVAVKRKKDHFSIIGGGRRLRAVLDQIAQGKLPADFQVPVMVVVNEKDAIEMSLTENYYGLAMNPADACEAFRNMIDKEGKTVEQVAKRLGLTRRFVEGRLRLANLAEPIFEALRASGITLDVAIAYASTPDTARQANVFAELADSYYSDNIGEIRRRLAVGTYKGADPKAIFVGRADYEAAGGRIAGDLFSNVETEDWIDGDILDRLAEEKLVASALAMRDREGFGEVRVVSYGRAPSWTETSALQRLDGEPVPLSDVAAARKTEIDAEVARIEEAADAAGDYTDEACDRLDQLQSELEELLDTGVIIPDDKRAAAIAYMVIGSDGEPRLHEQLYAEPIEDADENGIDDEGDCDHDAADESSDRSDKNGDDINYSARLIDELAMMKTELLAVHVAKDPGFARDLAAFITADNAIGTFGSYGMPSELRANQPSQRVANFESGTPAAAEWSRIEERLDRSWAGHEEREDRYDAFCALDDAARAAWLSWVVARTLHAVPEGAAGSGLLNRLGAKLAIDVASWWRPTARNFFDRLTKPAILKLFEAIGGIELRSRYAGSRKFDLAASAEKLFGGEIIAEEGVKERALAWIPTAMRFVPEDDQVEIDVRDGSADNDEIEPLADAA